MKDPYFMLKIIMFFFSISFSVLFSGCGFNDPLIFYNYPYEYPQEKTAIMVIAAHPDDEAIFFGGTLPYYTQVLKVPVIVINMTTNWLKDDGSQNKASLIREAEMRKATWRYGLRTEPIFALFQQNIRFWSINKTWDRWSDNKLNYHDVETGKMKTSTYLAEQIRLYKPEVILTHGFNGEYGNPDHKALAHAVKAAYTLAAGSKAIIDDSQTKRTIISPVNIEGEKWQAKKLYVHYSAKDADVINNLFHDFWEEISIDSDYDNTNDKSPREIANYGLEAHKSQGRHYVSSIFDKRGRVEFNKHPSELWSLVLSEVGQDGILEEFTVSGISGDTIFQGWSRGNFLQNLPEPY